MRTPYQLPFFQLPFSQLDNVWGHQNGFSMICQCSKQTFRQMAYLFAYQQTAFKSIQRTTVNIDPRGLLSSTNIIPWCASTTILQNANPRPIWETPLITSPTSYLSKMRCFKSSRIPMPSSAIRIVARFCSEFAITGRTLPRLACATLALSLTLSPG